MIATRYRIERNHFKDLKDLYSIHKLIYSLFPGDQRSFIFTNKGIQNGFLEILIISKNPPIFPEYGEITTKIIPESFLNKKRYAFEIIINAVDRPFAKNPTPIKGDENLSQWFISKSPSWGFSVDPSCLQLLEKHVEQFEKKGEMCTFNSVKFTGRLTVLDHNLFVNKFKSGIGRGKAFGFGLLQIRPLS